jgi:hypothetical protein|eukprot:COSAG06_NODE_521_length_14727_cov_19.202283_3_plen_147_part_00
MDVKAAYQNSELRWSLEYTTTPPSGTHLVQFLYETIAPKNRSLGKLVLRLEGLPPSYYWRWKAVQMDVGAGTKVNSVKPKTSGSLTHANTSPAAASTIDRSGAGGEGAATGGGGGGGGEGKGEKGGDNNSPQTKAGTPSATSSSLV